MNPRLKYATVPTKVKNDNAEVEQGTIVKIVENDAFMQKVRILKREETLLPSLLMPLRGLCSLDVGTLDKVERILDVVYGINDGADPQDKKDECLELLAQVRKDLIGCDRAVDQIEKTKINYLYYCDDKDGCYYCGENCVTHLGLALLWAFGFMEGPSSSYKKPQLQPV